MISGVSREPSREKEPIIPFESPPVWNPEFQRSGPIFENGFYFDSNRPDTIDSELIRYSNWQEQKHYFTDRNDSNEPPWFSADKYFNFQNSNFHLPSKQLPWENALNARMMSRKLKPLNLPKDQSPNLSPEASPSYTTSQYRAPLLVPWQKDRHWFDKNGLDMMNLKH